MARRFPPACQAGETQGDGGGGAQLKVQQRLLGEHRPGGEAGCHYLPAGDHSRVTDPLLTCELRVWTVSTW